MDTKDNLSLIDRAIIAASRGDDDTVLKVLFELKRRECGQTNEKAASPLHLTIRESSLAGMSVVRGC